MIVDDLFLRKTPCQCPAMKIADVLMSRYEKFFPQL